MVVGCRKRVTSHQLLSKTKSRECDYLRCSYGRKEREISNRCRIRSNFGCGDLQLPGPKQKAVCSVHGCGPTKTAAPCSSFGCLSCDFDPIGLSSQTVELNIHLSSYCLSNTITHHGEHGATCGAVSAQVPTATTQLAKARSDDDPSNASFGDGHAHPELTGASA